MNHQIFIGRNVADHFVLDKKRKKIICNVVNVRTVLNFGMVEV